MQLYVTGMTMILVYTAAAALEIDYTKVEIVVHWIFPLHSAFWDLWHGLRRGARRSETVTLAIVVFEPGKIVPAESNNLNSFRPRIGYLTPASPACDAFEADVTRGRRHIK